ncbi:MAG: hypothetical protein U5K56_05245 [Halioglobus sp.]|nr:hypothetical protein [Halioglobus sp.]
MLDGAGRVVDKHELMNVLGAVRGYAEMLREDLGSRYPDIEAGLVSLLASVGEAQGEDAAAPTEHRIVDSDPGFILAVDDRQGKP